ncbi:MAG: RNA 2',3'-cyclic phosphodiesterase [Candidatus Aenigmarchaeota archaeon]|nr:RNA 2',3'-cyclic phosphodiesterase [Candidatus Aenigmarchaeota archaeon]
MVRCFIGISLPENVVRHVNTLKRAIEQLPIEAKFVEPENLHITLSFLGEIPEMKIPEISKVMDDVVGTREKFEVAIEKIVAIPSDDYVKVIALSLDSHDLEKLRLDLASAIDGDSKPPHLTICRVRKVIDKAVFKDGLEKIESSGMSMPVDEVCLFKSILGSGAPSYSKLHISYLR